MKILRVLSAVLMLVPSAGSAQIIDLKAALAAKNAKALSASTSNDASSASGASSGSGISPLSPYPSPVSLPSYGGPSSAVWSSSAAGPMCGAPEKQELDKITALNMIETQKTAQKLRSVNDEREDSAARYNALFEKQKLELSPLEFTLKRMQIESNIQEEKFKMELADMR
ncbi:MAG: hypothetical protein KGJ84_11680, partial [Elusimicrobia bacterium]|nr:hypothetical protein [Elusimicrobiota bacterium]